MGIKYQMEGKVVLLTGAARGLGKGVARKFLESGATVVITDITDKTGEAAAQELSATGPVEYMHMDVTNSTEIESAIRSISAKYGKLDIAVNNACYINPNTPFYEIPDQEMEQSLKVCLHGVFYGMKHEIKQMLTQKTKGVVINIASVNAFRPISGLLVYNAAKAGVEALTKSAALECAKDGIRVAGVAPGMILTEAVLSFKENDPVTFAQYASNIPYPIISDVSDIADCVIWLCSDAARTVTGSIMVIDSGKSI
jgi:NAD(P)-dependent dehydrogenase (short-subunit alcohol dehydrogenase family)